MNWGTKIVLGMIAFMLFIIGMVVYMFKIDGNDALVEKDYYEKGINYDTEYDAQKNVIDDNVAPDIRVEEHQITVKLKEEANYNIWLMRPSEAKKDVRLEGKTEGADHLISVPRNNLDKGLWSLRIEWQTNGKKYLYKKDLMI